MPFEQIKPAKWTWFSPWMIIGSVCILAAILLILAVQNINREEAFMERALLSQANVLMRSVEAGSRTGMMGLGWGSRHLQLLMEETAQQSDVFYLAVVTQNGRVVSHSDPSKLDRLLPVSVPLSGTTTSRFVGERKNVFEVIREYQPWHRQRAGNAWKGCTMPGRSADEKLYIVVGLDPSPFEEAQAQDVRQTALLFVIMLLIGAAGFMCLVWAHHYRSARSSLKDVQAFTATVMAQMSVGMMATDRAGSIQRANDAARAILKHEEIAGSIDDFPCFGPVARRLRQDGSVVEQEIQCRAGRGNEPIPLLVNGAAIRDGQERTAGYVFLFSDLTNIKHLEERLRRSERLAGLGRLAAGVAHEIRNPLSSIKGFATILAGRFREDERSRKIADVMVQEVDRLNRVVTELLDYARPTEITKQRTSCKELIENTLRLIEQDAGQNGISVQSVTVPRDLVIAVDSDRFSQVLLNLYLNAVQAMEQGGTLKVEAFQKNGCAVLRVSDTGSGIPPDHLTHIFDPYFTTKAQGVGLGLANVHKFIEAHGGEIQVESTPGEGTSFIIHLPLNGQANLENALP
jgi:two-component system sensor histidine kinase HydH